MTEANNLPVDEVFQALVARAKARDEEYRKTAKPYTGGDVIFAPRMTITRGGYAKLEVVVLDRPAVEGHPGLVFKVQLGLGGRFVRKTADGRLALTGEVPEILRGPAKLVVEQPAGDESGASMALDELVIRGARWRINNWSAIKADLVPVRSPSGGFALPVRKTLRFGGNEGEFDRVSVTLRTGAKIPVFEQTGVINPGIRLDK